MVVVFTISVFLTVLMGSSFVGKCVMKNSINAWQLYLLALGAAGIALSCAIGLH